MPGSVHPRGRLPGLQRDLREAAAGDGAGGGLGRALGPPPRGALHVQVGGVTQHIARAVFISFHNVSGTGSGSRITISGPSQQNPCLTVAMMDAGPGLTLLGSTATLQTVRISFLGAVAHVRHQTARSKYHGDFCED